MPDLNAIRQALQNLTENLKESAERDPRAPMESDDFNSLLRQAKQAIRSPEVQDLQEFSRGTTLGELVAKASILLGYVQAEHARNVTRGFGGG